MDTGQATCPRPRRWEVRDSGRPTSREAAEGSTEGTPVFQMWRNGTNANRLAGDGSGCPGEVINFKGEFDIELPTLR